MTDTPTLPELLAWCRRRQDQAENRAARTVVYTMRRVVEAEAANFRALVAILENIPASAALEEGR